MAHSTESELAVTALILRLVSTLALIIGRLVISALLH